jgi:hypothetical protein
MKKEIIGFKCYEDVDVGISNPESCKRLEGSPEDIERIIAFALQGGVEVFGLSENERQKYLKLEIDI